MSHVLVASDYGQIEVRIGAAASRDPKLLKAMHAPAGTIESDIHAQNVYRLFGIPYELQGQHKPLRTRAKNYFFGAIYGSEGYEVWEVLAKEILRDPELEAGGVPTIEEVASSIRDIRRSYPRYFDEWVPYELWRARERNNTVYTLYRRPRIIPDLTALDTKARKAAERECINHIIQGTAADLLRIAMLRVAKLARGRLILSVHDELVSRVEEEYSVWYADRMRGAMLLDQPLKDVPIVVDTMIGKNWAECHK